MNIFVFVKRVPDTESKIRLQPGTPSIVTDGLNFIISPYDEYAVEEALRLREKTGGEVRVFAIGKEDSLLILRKCLAMGADEAVLVKDEEAETFDGLRTSKMIAALLKKKFPSFDLLLFGKQSVGADNAQVPSMVAELLGLPAANVVTKLEIEGANGTALREIEGGIERAAFSLPAVVSAQKGLNEPRYETLKGIMAAKKKQIPVITSEDLGLAPEDLASGLEITGIDLPPGRRAGKILNGDPAEAARQLVDFLHREARVI